MQRLVARCDNAARPSIMCGALPRVHRHSIRRPAVKVAALMKDSGKVNQPTTPGPQQDWRMQKMSEATCGFLGAVLSRGDMGAAAEILDDDVVFRDMVWGPAAVVGSAAVKAHISELRFMYPDLLMEAGHMAMQDGNHLWASWIGHGTNLDSHNGAASYHNTTFSGITIFAFNTDRSKITEITVYRQPTADERLEMKPASSPLDIKLARLHWEPATAAASAATTHKSSEEAQSAAKRQSSSSRAASGQQRGMQAAGGIGEHGSTKRSGH